MLGKRIETGIIKGVKSSLIGLLVGPVMVFFAFVVDALGKINAKYPLLILTLPLSSILIMLLYKAFGENYKKMTTIAMSYIQEGEDADLGSLKKPYRRVRFSPLMGIASFFATVLSHISGASVGKESVGVQLGLSVSDIVSKIDEKYIKKSVIREDHYMMCGAAAAFGALFGSPVAGTLFGLTFSSPELIRAALIIPCLISSYSAVIISSFLNIHRITIPPFSPLEVNIENFLAVFFFSVLLGLFSFLFVKYMNSFRTLLTRVFKRKFLAYLLPSILLLLSFLLVFYFTGKNDYSSLSLSLLYGAVRGEEIAPYAFLLKALFLFLSLSAGFVGGEVVPLFVTGATFGSFFATLFSLNRCAFAALGALGMLSGGTNLPLVCFALGLELFSYTEPTLLFLVVAFAFLFSGKESIYKSQREMLGKRIFDI